MMEGLSPSGAILLRLPGVLYYKGLTNLRASVGCRAGVASRFINALLWLCIDSTTRSRLKLPFPQSQIHDPSFVIGVLDKSNHH